MAFQARKLSAVCSACIQEKYIFCVLFANEQKIIKVIVDSNNPFHLQAEEAWQGSKYFPE